MNYQVKRNAKAGSSAKMASKLCIPENVVDKEKIHSRIFSQAPLQAPSYTGATFFVNRLTKAQEVTKNRKKRFQAEPLPALAKYQAQQQRQAILDENRRKLIEAGWESPVVQLPKPKKSRKRFATVSTTLDALDSQKKLQKKDSDSSVVFPPLVPRSLSIRRSHSRANTEVTPVSKLSLDEIVAMDINDPLKLIEIVTKNKKIGFMYLMSRDKRSSNSYRPYDLQIVAFNEIDPENYMTISDNGVISVYDGEATFTELKRWEEEYRSYCQLIAIPRFKLFRQWKLFVAWRKYIRRKKMDKCSKLLVQSLPALDQYLRPALLQVKKVCCRVAEVNLLVIDKGLTYQLDNFRAINFKNLFTIRKKLAEFHIVLREAVRNSCRDYMHATGFVPDENYFTEGKDSSKSSSFNSLDSGSSARLLKKKSEKPHFKDPPEKMTYTQQANKRIQCQRLTRFIRLADYLILSTLHHMVVDSLTILLQTLNVLIEASPSDEAIMAWNTAFDENGNLRTPSPVRSENTHSMTHSPVSPVTVITEPSPSVFHPPLFITELEIGVDSIAFVPDVDSFHEVIDAVILRFQQTVLTVPSLYIDRHFDSYTRPVINGKVEKRLSPHPPNLLTVFEEDEHLQDIMTNIKENINKAFKKVNVYARTMDPFYNFYRENELLDLTALRQTDHDVTFFSESLDRYHLQHKAAQGIESKKTLGLLLVDSTNFRNRLIPNPLNCLDAINELLPSLAKQYMDEILSEVQDAQFKLEFQPGTTLEHVEYLTFMDEVQDRVEALDDRTGFIVDMYELINQYKVPHPPEDHASFKTLRPTITKLLNVLDKSVSNRDACIEKFRILLDKDIADLVKEVKVIKHDCQDPHLLDLRSQPTKIMATIARMKTNMEAIQKRAFLYKFYQKRFKVSSYFRELLMKSKDFLEATRFEELEEVHAELQLKELLWESITSWDAMYAGWLKTPFDDLKPDDLNQQITKYLKYIHQLEKGLPPNLVVPRLAKKVSEMRKKMPVVTNLHNPNLKSRHWEALEHVIGQKFPPGTPDAEGQPCLNLKVLAELGAFDNSEVIEEISGQASGEAALEKMLKKVEDIWRTLELVVLPHRDAKDVFILGGTDDIQVQLDDSRVAVATVASSRYVAPIKENVANWQKQLNLMSDTLDEWLTCQRNWLYLESIFSAPDIQRQLPAEAKMFMQVDRTFKEIMRKANRLPNVMRACTQPGLLEQFENCNILLDQIQQCLEAYLESKRAIFPRFYFLSNDELLEILAQTRNPQAVQPHLRKCFDAIAMLEFANIRSGNLKSSSQLLSADKPSEVGLSNDITAMVSPEGEIVYFGRGLKARGNVEEWLGKVEEAMVATLKRISKSAITEFHESSLEDWCLSLPSQVVLTISQTMWCESVTMILTEESKHIVLEDLTTFEEDSFCRLNELAALVRTDLASLQRNVITSLITVDVHARDIITEMVRLKVDCPSNFEWLRQLRYYWEPEIDDVAVRCAGSQYVYGYEYLGACPRLVITPLTDRCYLCLMGALQLDLGGSPVGPAGTGKTETTKDLAKALAKQCVVFNCSEGLDFKIMGRFFSGLAQSGAWCCFDEFNRIDIEVLSVIAKQLLTIRHAKASKQSRFMFEGREIKLDPTCAAFITMNPGYAGRTELPDNLKALFRPIAMMVPDYKLIAEVILYSEGFESSKTLAQKMVQMYKLCSEQLSQQDHYDFGMRAVKSVLVMAGSLRRENPDIREDIVLIRALRDSNLPKFLHQDAILFSAILTDLFPGMEIPEHDYGVLESTIKICLEKESFEPAPSMVKKIIQLYETVVVRHGVMLVGPTGGGKTTVYHVLSRTLTKLHTDGVVNPYYKPVDVTVMNPKSITMGELYGEQNPLTLEWKDGLMALTVRQAVQNADGERFVWIVCDGPVDSLWIENMNTVLDDNKMLCLANSERIKLNDEIRMMFEVQDLAVASPATVSRCGMVYVDPSELGWRPYVCKWMNTKMRRLKEETYLFLMDLFDAYVDDGLYYAEKELTAVLPHVRSGKIATLCMLLQSLLLGNNGPDLHKEPSHLHPIVANCFLFCYIWSIAGNLNERSFDMFDTFARNLFEDHPCIVIPSHSDLFSHFVNLSTGHWESWEQAVPVYTYKNNSSCLDVLVPTTDTLRYSYLMENLLHFNKSVLFTGGTGVGKSVVARNLLESISKEHSYVPVFMNFSAQTSSSRIQEFIESKLERKKKNVLSAPEGKRVIIFIDDLNMPKLDRFGSQPPIELLRQYQDFHGFYDREKLFWKKVLHVTIAAACAPPGGGRNQLTPRFVRHFAVFSMPSPSEYNLQTIFSAIVRGFLFEFPAPVRDSCHAVVEAAIEIYRRMSTDLLPTPNKSHYVFNLRDLSKCVQGILRANPNVINEKIDIFNLFCHEALRVFHDRLINDEDKEYFCSILAEVAKRYFAHHVEAKQFIDKAIIFGDFIHPQTPLEDRIYEDYTDRMNELGKILHDYLDNFNHCSSKEMSLVFFQDAIEHIARIVRILVTERGNALLVGVGGCGKQSLTRLACFICGYQCVQIELTRNYNYSSFHEDLRKIYLLCGARGKNTVFLFTDTQIVQEELLEDINNILNSGEVPNLFEKDDLEQVLAAVRPMAKEAGIAEGNRDGIFQHFIARVRQKLHVVLCMSPVGSAFRSRCRMFPSLVNCCTIDWFIPWPPEALLSVSEMFFKQVFDLDDNHKVALSKLCVKIHSSVNLMADKFYEELRRHYYTTPTSYLELINLYLSMLKSKRSELVNVHGKYKKGLTKLLETNSLVDTMQEELTILEPVLKQKSAETEELMQRLTVDQEEADKVRRIVLEDEAMAIVKAEETQEIADDAQKDLNEALPILHNANKALDALDKSDIAELKVFAKPPDLVMTVMETVCILLNAKTDWTSAKAILGDANFLRRLLDYDKDNIPQKILKKLDKYIANPEFVPDKVEKVSKACRSMCMWVRAMHTYSQVVKEVEPKRERFRVAQQELNVTMKQLREKQKLLKDVEAEINDLQAQYDESVDEKDRLIKTQTLTRARMGRAGKLTTALSDEQIRWQEKVNEYEIEINNVVGDVFIAAACVAYCGAFTSTYREQLISEWIVECQQELPTSSKISLVKILGDPYEIRLWNEQGLPRDNLSTENAIIVTRARRWPLMIDPQNQANSWIRNKEMPNELKIIKLTESDFLRTLENSIRIGMPVLCEEVKETLDPALEPVLLKQTFQSGGRTMIHLGDSDIEYDKNFRFYMTSKMGNPHYLPEICVKVTIINFTVTRLGLEDQILSDVVRLERPDLESQRNELISSINHDKAQLASIEDAILKLLFTSKGNILDNEDLINALNDSKITSEVISTRLLEAETTEQSITEAREKYRPVATRGSVLFFVVASLCEIDPMYQFSLQYFTIVFNQTLSKAQASQNLKKRLKILINDTTFAIYRNVSRGLFERHKLIFSFMLCTDIVREAGLISNQQWNFFLLGAGGVEKDPPPKPKAKWLSEELWKKVYDLEYHLDSFRGLTEDLTRVPVFCEMAEQEIRLNPETWVDYEYLEAPPLKPSCYAKKSSHSESFHSDDDVEVWNSAEDFEAVFLSRVLVEELDENVVGHWDERLNLFEKLIFVKLFLEEKIVEVVVDFVATILGKEFVENPSVTLASLYADMNHLTPLVFVLSAGSDPMGALMRFAHEMDYIDKLEAISLGQGQGPVAEKLMTSACENGGWVFLQNCHLAKSFMHRLEELCKEITQRGKGAIHKNYRLFLSSMPTAFFPVTILQGSVKVTNEAPKGIRSNIRGALGSVSSSFFEDHSLGLKWRKMIFGICFFHAIIQERKKFGPLGWNIQYEFTESDRECAMLNLQLFCKNDVIPWDALVYITGEITYGGRVTDALDQRCLRTILARFFEEKTLHKDYCYSESGLYYAPEANLLSEYQEYVNDLPASDDPEIFGMHNNANLTYLRRESHNLLHTILQTQPRVCGGGAGKAGDEIVGQLAGSILDKLDEFQLTMDNYDRIRKVASQRQSRLISRSFSSAHSSRHNRDDGKARVNSLTTVLEQEVARFRNLLDCVRTSLHTLKKAIAGLVVMGEQMEKMYRSLMNSEVPTRWESAAYPSLKLLGAWVKDLVLRCKFVDRWSTKVLPTSYWISGFFFPQGFLTGVLQNHARKHDFPIDRLNFCFNPLSIYRDEENYQSVAEKMGFGEDPPDDKKLPSIKDGVFIHGLFTDAFSFDVKAMKMTSERDRVMHEMMPLLHLQPQMDFSPQDDDYMCPLYKTGARAGVLSTTGHSTNFVISVHLPTDVHTDFWISRGSALLCGLET